MTQQSGTQTADSGSDTLFKLIGVALVALSAVVLVAVLWYTVGLAALQSIASPFVLGTVVFTVVVAIVFKKSSDVVDREIAHKRSRN
ncbi:hypothetical protein [Halohasta litorea]|uniref:Uncharacterized protein n=1 Tax=Halohasta litorea TaxID=869891 RepID=A0ABD6D3E3_9EURY|nr:hypothetical protein [Halohasta litorea]